MAAREDGNGKVSFFLVVVYGSIVSKVIWISPIAQWRAASFIGLIAYYFDLAGNAFCWH